MYYYPNKRSVAMETLCEEINKTGNTLIVLTQQPVGDFHKALGSRGVTCHAKVYNYRISLLNYLFHFFYLIRFCRKHRINVLWSHLNQCNLVAVFAQRFIKARTVIFRHHFHASIKKEGFASVNKNELKVDRLVIKKAREIVVPSQEVYNGMVKYENADPSKISIIPYIYHFDQYAKPDEGRVTKIREEYPAGLLVITASRMIKMKRHDLVLPVYKKLIEDGLSIKVLLLDEGEEKERLQQYVADNKLAENIFFLGYRTNIVDYLAAADLLVHPSYTEASSSLVKEFGLFSKPVIVCSGVGDFDQYIVNAVNGYVVNPPQEAEEFEKHIRFVYNNREAARQAGNNLRESVLKIFSPNEATMGLYLAKI